jgi:hypothetical protein
VSWQRTVVRAFLRRALPDLLTRGPRGNRSFRRNPEHDARRAARIYWRWPHFIHARLTGGPSQE